MYQANVYRVLIASPMDVSGHRDAAVQALLDWNSAHSADSQIALLPVRWETDGYPEMGDRAQELLNRQIVDNSDILIGIFWTRLGTPTGDAASGTDEEINRFLEQGKPVMLYFSSQDVPQDRLEPDEYKRLQAYKQACSSEGIVQDFSSTEQLRLHLSRHLPGTIRKLQTENPPQPLPAQAKYVYDAAESGPGSVWEALGQPTPIRTFELSNVTFKDDANSNWPGVKSAFSFTHDSRSTTQSFGATEYPLSQAGRASFEIWFRAEASRLAKGPAQLLFETGGYSNGLSLLIDRKSERTRAKSLLKVRVKHAIEETPQAIAVEIEVPNDKITKEFCQLVAVADPGHRNLSIFVNGERASSRDDFCEWQRGPDPAALGGSESDIGGVDSDEEVTAFTGDIAIFRAYSTAINDTQVKAKFDEVASNAN